MINIDKTFFGLQIGSILAYVVGLFVLYRLLVRQKDSTIENLKTEIELLKEQNQYLKEPPYDILIKKLRDRIAISKKALEDQECENKSLISEKEEKLNNALGTIEEYENQLVKMKVLMKEYFCPYCEAPMTEKKYYSIPYDEHSDDEFEIIEYECGLSLKDGRVTSECKYKR